MIIGGDTLVSWKTTAPSRSCRIAAVLMSAHSQLIFVFMTRHTDNAAAFSARDTGIHLLSSLPSLTAYFIKSAFIALES